MKFFFEIFYLKNSQLTFLQKQKSRTVVDEFPKEGMVHQETKHKADK